MCLSNKFKDTANVTLPDDPSAGSADTVARATAILKEISGAPLSSEEQHLIEQPCKNCGNCTNMKKIAYFLAP